MPRPAKPPRLYLRDRPGRPSWFVILDGGRELSTGFGADDKREAEKAFAQYLADKHRPDFRDGDPARVAVADVLTYYMEEAAPRQASPELVGYHVPRLLSFFGRMTCAEVPPACRSYVTARMKGLQGRQPVKEPTAGRELDTLAAALNFAFANRKLDRPVRVDKPPRSDPSPKWLTRPEAARLLAGALGFRSSELDHRGRARKWKRVSAPNHHLARFILIGLYTGTRHASILNLRWKRSPDAGWVDLDNGTLYRRGYEERETKKRRPPAPIPKNLLPHLERWARMTVHGPCEYAGEIMLRHKTAFAHARDLAGLGKDVTPHTLKHTCITWMLQAGVSTWEVAGFSGTSEGLIRRVYGHHCRDHMENATAAFRQMRRRR